MISFQCDQDLSIILTSLRELEIQSPRNKIGTGTLKLQSLCSSSGAIKTVSTEVTFEGRHGRRGTRS